MYMDCTYDLWKGQVKEWEKVKGEMFYLQDKQWLYVTVEPVDTVECTYSYSRQVDMIGNMKLLMCLYMLSDHCFLLEFFCSNTLRIT